MLTCCPVFHAFINGVASLSVYEHWSTTYTSARHVGTVGSVLTAVYFCVSCKVTKPQVSIGNFTEENKWSLAAWSPYRTTFESCRQQSWVLFAMVLSGGIKLDWKKFKTLNERKKLDEPWPHCQTTCFNRCLRNNINHLFIKPRSGLHINCTCRHVSASKWW